MKMSTVCPIPAGCAILRDIRCWHGGTPCVGSTPRWVRFAFCSTLYQCVGCARGYDVWCWRRAMPSCNFHAPWFCTNSATPRVMPRKVYEQLDERGQYLCRLLVADPDEKLELGWKADGA